MAFYMLNRSLTNMTIYTSITFTTFLHKNPRTNENALETL